MYLKAKRKLRQGKLLKNVGQFPIMAAIFKIIGQAWWHVPVVPVTQDLKSLRPA
jgi:hypothetical protein